MSATQTNTNVFDFVNDISFEKQYIFDQSTERYYDIFLINKAFMQHVDTVMLANEVNKMRVLHKIFAHDYLYYSVDKKKRFGKWVKPDTDIELALTNIMNKYGCNVDVAKQYYNMLSEERQIEMNKERVKGGKK